MTTFVGMAALGGAVAVLPSAPNAGQILAPLQRWPLADFFFADLAWPRVFLLLIVGASQVVAAVLIVGRHGVAWLTELAGGCCLTGWVCLGLLIYKGDPGIATLPVTLVFTAIAVAEIAMAVVWRSGQKSAYQRLLKSDPTTS
ncbi:MAG: hypothetical protein LBJ44_04580 [Propionibacteriaceae bacterium]|jgi:hypothetical protein|nr:hypothetical protein [Propionibacteriaceae bacterium]